MDSKDKIKILHASELKALCSLPRYDKYLGITLDEYEVRRGEIKNRLWEFRVLRKAQERLAALDISDLVEYTTHRIDIPRSLPIGSLEIDLPEPEYPGSHIVCDAGKVTGKALRLPRSFEKRQVIARYRCPSNVYQAKLIADLKVEIAQAGREGGERLEAALNSKYLQPVIFVSHRWEGLDQPDPHGRQLKKLKGLKDCFLIYDYSSFPQVTETREEVLALRDILSCMNQLIDNVIVLSAPDYLQRGWCIYEYLVASMRAAIACDELNEPDFVCLRNLSATVPPQHYGISGGGLEAQIQNAKNHRILDTVNKLLPAFNRSKFTVAHDREIVRELLVAELIDVLPSRKEYIQYMGEWKNIPWTKEELNKAFTSELRWDHIQHISTFKPYEQKVAMTIPEAVENRYHIDRMPMQNEWTCLSLLDSSAVNAILEGGMEAVGVIIVVAILGLLVLSAMTWWLFFVVEWAIASVVLGLLVLGAVAWLVWSLCP